MQHHLLRRIAVFHIRGVTTVAAGLLLAMAFLAISPGQLPRRTEGIRDENARLIQSLDGAALFRSYCAVCHGSDARGAGPMAASLRTAPSDLTRIAVRNHGAYPAARIERIIAGDEQIPGGHGNREMPVWGPIFSQIAWDQDLGRVRIHNLAEYIGRLQVQ